MPCLLAKAAIQPSTKPGVPRRSGAVRERRLRCVIISNHGLLTDLLAITFSAAPDLPVDVVEVAASASAGIKACDEHRPGVVLLDLAVPDGGGLDVAKHVAATLPDTRIVVVSAHGGDDVKPAGQRRQMRGVVREAGTFNALQAILVDVVGSGGGRAAANGSSAGGGRRLANVLSRREREVLSLIGQRLSSRAIAERLAVSLHTINAHRKNIARKLGVQGVNLALVAHDYREQLANRP